MVSIYISIFKYPYIKLTIWYLIALPLIEAFIQFDSLKLFNSLI